MVDSTLVVVVAGAFAVGCALLVAGFVRLRAVAVRQQRVARALQFEAPLGPGAPYAAPLAAATRPRPSVDREHVKARALVLGEFLLQRIGQHDEALRSPLLVLACLAGVIGVFTLAWPWMAVALASAAASYALGGRTRRRRQVADQALTAIQLLSSGLRAGYSVPQALALVARNSPEPTATEYNVTTQEIALGVGLADALANFAKRNANQDYALVAIIVGVQHDVGGNLAHILDSVTNTLRERIQLRHQVEALTAQQRLSSIVLTLLPFGLLLFLAVMDRSFVEPLFTDTMGRLLLGLAAVMVLIGWTIMRSIGRVEL